MQKRLLVVCLFAMVCTLFVPSNSYAWGWYPGKFLFGRHRVTYYYTQPQRVTQAACSTPTDTPPTCTAEPVAEKEYAIERIEEDFELTQQEKDLVDATNQWRLRCGMNALTINIALCKASRAHSEFMYRTGRFGHSGIGDGTLTTRAAQQGTTCHAENIAGVGNGQQAFSMFQHSRGHNANMLGSHSEIGVGIIGNKTTQMFR